MVRTGVYGYISHIFYKHKTVCMMLSGMYYHLRQHLSVLMQTVLTVLTTLNTETTITALYVMSFICLEVQSCIFYVTNNMLALKCVRSVT